jgi:hypothetical protein
MKRKIVTNYVAIKWNVKEISKLDNLAKKKLFFEFIKNLNRERAADVAKVQFLGMT